jgi:transposase
VPFPFDDLPDDFLLKPKEVADIFGVRTTTIARWARTGRLPSKLTVGGHRRYRWAQVRALLKPVEVGTEQERLEQDAARLYDQGWTIRRVAEKFDYGYGAMRHILQRRTTLRSRGGRNPRTFAHGNGEPAPARGGEETMSP